MMLRNSNRKRTGRYACACCDDMHNDKKALRRMQRRRENRNWRKEF